MNTAQALISILVAMLAVTLPAAAQLYQYTDKSGNVVFTDTPPKGAKAAEVNVNNDRVFRSAPRREEPLSEQHAAPFVEERRKRDYSEINVVMYMTSW